MEKELTKEEVIARNKELIKKYPWLLPHNRWTDEVSEDYDYSYTELDALDDGWRKAFGEQMCEEIQAELEKFDFVDKYRIMQIKEKYGMLRLYDGGTPIGKLSDVMETIIVDDWREAPHSDFDRNVWTLVKKTDDGKYIYEHRKILEKCNVDRIIRRYEDISARTCIRCGKPATKISMGWICPWCDDCAKEIGDNESYVDINDYYKREVDLGEADAE